jgi:hypothetical protein
MISGIIEMLRTVYFHYLMVRSQTITRLFPASN